MPRQLTQLNLREVSLVDRPASPGARVLLYKADDSKFGPCADCPDKEACTKADQCSAETAETAEKSVKAILALSAPTVEKRRLIDTVLRKLHSEGYEAVADTILKSLPSDMKENAMPDPNKDTVTKADMDKAIADAVAKAVGDATASRDTEIKKAVDAAEAKANERIAKAEAKATALVEVTEKRDRITKADTILKGITGAPTAVEFESVLKMLDAEQTKLVEKAFDACRAQVSEAQKILKAEKGVATIAKGNAHQQALTKAQEITKADPKTTQAAALAKVWMDNPDLYAQYLDENGQGAKH